MRLVCGSGFITVAYTGKGFMCTDLSVPSNVRESGANVVPTAFHLTKQSRGLRSWPRVPGNASIPVQAVCVCEHVHVPACKVSYLHVATE